MMRFGFFLFAAACAAWSVSIGVHELLGHGGVCAINPQCKWIYADAMYFQGTAQEGGWKIAGLAAGSVVNVMLGLSALYISLRFGLKLGVLAIPIHLLIPVNFIQAGAYIALGGFIHEGMDWAQLTALSNAPEATQKLFLIMGAILVLAGVAAAKWAAPIVRSGSVLPIGWTFYVLISYFGYSATALAASAFVPSEDRLFMLAGGLGSGALFMSFYLLSLLPVFRAGAHKTAASPPARMIVAFAFFTIVTVAYVFLLGRGIYFETT